MSESIHIIVYTSQFCGEPATVNQVLTDITQVAQKNNVQYGITGALFHHNGTFLQVIEGSRQSIDGLMAIITKDSRHKNVKPIIDQKITQRGFSQWNMDHFNLNEKQTLDPQELTQISEAFTLNFRIDSQDLIDFYKFILEESK